MARPKRRLLWFPGDVCQRGYFSSYESVDEKRFGVRSVALEPGEEDELIIVVGVLLRGRPQKHPASTTLVSPGMKAYALSAKKLVWMVLE